MASAHVHRQLHTMLFYINSTFVRVLARLLWVLVNWVNGGNSGNVSWCQLTDGHVSHICRDICGPAAMQRSNCHVYEAVTENNMNSQITTRRHCWLYSYVRGLTSVSFRVVNDVESSTPHKAITRSVATEDRLTCATGRPHKSSAASPIQVFSARK